MAEQKIASMSEEELKLYKQQLQEKLAEVNFYLQNFQRAKNIPK